MLPRGVPGRRGAQRHDVEPNLSRTQVVVGVDGSDLTRSAIGSALAAAAERGIGLTAGGLDRVLHLIMRR